MSSGEKFFSFKRCSQFFGVLWSISVVLFLGSEKLALAVTEEVSTLECESTGSDSDIELKIEKKGVTQGSQSKYDFKVSLSAKSKGKAEKFGRVSGEALIKGQSAFTDNLVQGNGPNFAVSTDDFESTAKVFDLNNVEMVEGDYPVYATKHPVSGDLPGYLVAVKVKTKGPQVKSLVLKGILSNLQGPKSNSIMIGGVYYIDRAGKMVSGGSTQFECSYKSGS